MLYERAPAIDFSNLAYVRAPVRVFREIFGVFIAFAVCATRVTRGALVAHGNSFTFLRCEASQYRRSVVPLSGFLWNDLNDPVDYGV